MIRLIKWQFREYRKPRFQRIALLFVGAAVVAWFSYSLFDVPIGPVVAVLHLVQIGLLSGAITFHYVDLLASEGNVTLHVPQPGWWVLLAKLVGILPILIGYIAINAVLCLALPPDLQQLAELSPARTFFRAASAIYWVGAIINALVVLSRFGKLRGGLHSAQSYIAFIIVLMPYAILAGGFTAWLGMLGLPVTLQALIVAAVGLLLTFVNGYLLEHYTPQLKPWV